MKIKPFILSGLAVFVLAFATGPSSAHDFNPMTLTEAVDQADLIVVATAERKGPGKSRWAGALVVESVVKGPAGIKRVEMDHLGVFMSEPIKDGVRGVFLLSELMGSYFFSHPSTIRTEGDPAAQIKKIKSSMQMLEDPAPFFEAAEGDLSMDLVYALGQELRAFRIHSPQTEALTPMMLGLHLGSRAHGKMFPWEIQEELEIRVSFDEAASPPLRVETDRPDARLFDALSDHLKAVSTSDAVKPVLREVRTITLDTRRPDKVGGMDAEEARRALRGMVRPGVAYEKLDAVLRALSLARDLEAIDAVARLLESDASHEVVLGARWLGWAGSDRATPALMGCVKRADPDSEEFDRALRKVFEAMYRIGDVSVLPAVRDWVQADGFYTALMLGRYGEAEDMGLLIRANAADPTRSSAMQTAMFRLVKRSNREVEDWMISPIWDGNIGREKQAKWEAWWAANETGFAVVRSHEAAFDGT